MVQKLFSYYRWSSDRQEAGTTLQRQMEGARAFAAANNLEMVEVIDAGISAFKGKNTQDGALGDFIAAVEAQAIPSDSWLYVENLDRLTRQDVTVAQELFLKLLRLGLHIVTGMDQRVYTNESVNKNPTDLMLSILLFSRGNEESKTKQARTIGNVMALIDRHNKGEPTTIKAAGRCPFWIDSKSGSKSEKCKPHPVLWQPAREALDLFLEGHGTYTVQRYLNEKYPNANGGKEWNYQAIHKMRDNRALLGEMSLKIQGKIHILKDYYPALLKDENEFFKLQELKKQNLHKSKKDQTKNNIKLLSGLDAKLRCAKCNGTMHGYLNKGKPRYKCLNGGHSQKGCYAWSVAAPFIEHCVIIALIMAYIDEGRSYSNDTSFLVANITEKQEQSDELVKKIKNLVSLAGMGLEDVAEIGVQIREFQTEQNVIKQELARLHEKKRKIEEKGTFEDNMMDFAELIKWSVFSDIKNEKRNKIREIISSLVEFARIKKDEENAGCISIKVKCYSLSDIFVFSGFNRKPHWQFYTESADATVNTKAVSEVIEKVKSHPKMGVLLELKERQNQHDQDLLKTVFGMLEALGYPELKGSSFWPNR